MIRGDEVLLLRHPSTHDRFPEQWNGIGGHVEEGECIRAAARREVREETGLELDSLALRGIVHESGLLGHAHVLFIFIAEQSDADLLEELDSPEGLLLAWQPLGDLTALPLVHDVDVLLERALSAREPFFALETYAEGAVPTSVRIEAHA